MKKLITILLALVLAAGTASAASYYFSYQNDNYAVSYHKYEPYQHNRHNVYYADSYAYDRYYYAPVATVHYDTVISDGYWTFAPDYIYSYYSNYNYYPSYSNAYYDRYYYSPGYNSRYAYSDPYWLR